MSEIVTISKEELESIKEQLKNCSFEKSQLQVELFKANGILHSNEEYFRLVLENSQEFIFSIDRQYRLRSCNKMYQHALRSATGRDIKIGESILLAEFPSEQQMQRQNNYDRVLAGESLRVEIQLNWDDKLHFFDYHLNPLKNSIGEIIGVVGVAHDITEIKQGEQALKQSLEYQRAIADYAYDWENWVGPDGKLIWVNPAVTRISGYSVDECKKMENFPIPIIDISDQDRITAHFRDAVLGSSGNDVEFRIQHKDGTQKWGAASWQPIFDSDGKSLGHRSSIRDITDRKKAEEALKRSETKYRRLYENLTDAFAQVDMKGNLVMWNESFKNMLGFSDEELTNSTNLEITSPNWHAFEQDIIEKQVLVKGYSDVYEKEYIKKDGTILPVELRAILLKDDAGKPSGMWAIVRDISERKRSEKALLESENRYRDLFENSPISLWEEDFSAVKTYIDSLKNSGIVDLRSYFENHPEEVHHCLELIKIVDINRATLDLYQVPDKNLFKLNLISFFNEKSFYTFRELLLALAEGKNLYKSEAVNLTLRGDTIHISLSVTTKPVYENTWSKIIVSIEDISERKMAEEALRQHEQLLDQIFEILPVGLWLTDRSGVIIRGNSACKRIWGGVKYVAMEDYAQYKAWWADSGKLIEPLEWAAARAVNKGETSINEEIVIESFGGISKTILNSCIPVRGINQEITGALIVNQDITEKKRSERALRESEEIMRYIIKYDPNAIAVFDRNLHYIATSDRFLQDYNVKEGNIIGKHHYEVFPEMPQIWKDIHRRVLHGEIIRNDDDSFKRSDGSITYNRWECRPWYNGNSEIGGMITYTEVTTERKLAELALISEKEQLVKANCQLDKANERFKELDELKTKFVSIASHELRTPIASIIGFSQTLLSEDIPINDQERKQYLHIIEGEGKRLGALIQNLLDIAKIEKGGAEQNFEEFNIADLAQETIKTMLIPAQLSVGVEKTTRVEPKVFAVRERIRQVIRNLLDNAFRHTAPGGSITIFITQEHEDIIVSIKDTGTGIPEGELTKIFERFHRVKGDRGSKGEGTGLGLAIAKEIIQSHNGRIWAESKLGVGSTFFFTLPLKRGASRFFVD